MVRPCHFLSTFPLAASFPFAAPWYPLASSGSGWNLLLLLTFPSPFPAALRMTSARCVYGLERECERGLLSNVEVRKWGGDLS